MSVAQNLPAYLPADGLVAWYPFNGNANDESGNGLNGTILGGVSLSNDRFNNINSCYQIDGVNCSVPKGINVPATINNINDYSLCIWYRITNTSKQYQCLINSYPHNFIGANFNYLSENTVSFFVGNGNWWPELVDSLAIQSPQDWNQLTIVKQNLNFKYYNNGVHFKTITFSESFNTGSISSFVLGAISINGGENCFETFQGQLDDIAIYNRALTQEEITALYTGTPVNGGGGSTSGNSAPSGIPYQAVVRNANGSVVANTAVTTRFTLHQNTADGVVEYQETHAVTTNAQGLMATVLGQGAAVQNTFAAINWANTTKFLQVEVDLGNGYVDLGTQQLMSVPYAMYAANGPQGAQGPQGPAGADGAQGLQGPAGTSVQSVVQSNNQWVITFSDGSTTTFPIGNGNSATNSQTFHYLSDGF